MQPPARQAAQPQSPPARQATQPQSPPPGPATQPQSPPPRSATQPQSPPAPAAKRATPTRTAAARNGTADQAGAAPVPRAADNPPASAALQAPVAPAVPVTAPPKPPRKPLEALSLSARRPPLGDPLPLDGGSQGPAADGPDVALAAPEPALPKADAPPEPEPDPYAAVPMLWQLPSVIRSKLPELSMSVHVYSPEAAGRFVIVDRKKYREGDVVTGGVKLEAIVADGIVLDYQGRRYRIAN